MSETFLSRWSRRKAETRMPAEPAVATPAAAPPPAVAAVESPAEPAPLPDVASLDPATSDFSPFLADRVPAELRREALRKLWSDPAFAAPEAMDLHAVGLAGISFGGTVATLFRVGQGMAEALAPEDEEEGGQPAAEKVAAAPEDGTPS